VTTSKTFTPDKPGDFSGGMVDLRTREFPLGREIAYSLSFGYNDAATSKNAGGGDAAHGMRRQDTWRVNHRTAPAQLHYRPR
jgi:hypothetical protein